MYDPYQEVLEQIDLALQYCQHLCYIRLQARTDLYHPQFTLGQVSQLNLLDGDSLSGSPVEGLVHRPKRSLAQAFS